jgi:hypothetical protein
MRIKRKKARSSMRGSPELLTGDLSENFLKALPPSLLPRYALI